MSKELAAKISNANADSGNGAVEEGRQEGREEERLEVELGGKPTLGCRPAPLVADSPTGDLSEGGR